MHCHSQQIHQQEEQQWIYDKFSGSPKFHIWRFLDETLRHNNIKEINMQLINKCGKWDRHWKN
jgi:hypothetical protein